MTEANSGGVVVNCCVGCERPIMDKYYPCIDDQIWHQDCLRCVICRIHLVGRCFVRNGQYFCRNDFVSPRCPTCLETILPTDLVRLLGSVAYHADCFRCVLCARCLATGDEYRPLGDGVRFICLEHEAPTLALPAAPTDPRPCGAGTPQSSSRSDGVFDDSGGGGVNDEVKHEGEFLLQSEVVKEAAYYEHRDSYASTEAGLGHFVSSEPEQEREVDSPMYAGNLDADDRSEECGLELGEAEAETEGEGEPEEGSKAPSGVDEAAGSPASNEVSAAATNAPLPTQGSIEGGGNSLLTKRRGPRTTIKAKQLDTLKQAFATTPKPSRHIREQLAQETGLSMRVIQVWFQNRRSKERRMKQLSALGVRRPFFPQQQHHSHHHHHHQPVRRMRIGGGGGGGVGGGGGSVASRDVCAFGPEDLPAEVMAELLHVPPPLSLPQPSAYQNGLFCVGTQREFYNAMASEAGNALPVGSSMFAYGPSPPPPPPPPPLPGYGNAFPEGGVVYPSSQEALVKKGPLSPDRPLPCEQDLAKTSDDQTNDSSVYFSDGGGYAVGKTTLSPLLEPFPQLAQSRITRGAAFHHNHHHHHHHLQASGGQQLTHLSPVRSQAGASDQLVPAGVLECSW